MRLGAWRGNSRHAPEHSRAALLSAYTLGADVLYCDVRVTADGIPVLSADDAAAGMSLDELRRVDMSSGFLPRGSPGYAYRAPGRAPVRVEPLADALDWLPPDVSLVLGVDAASVDPALAAVKSRGAADRVVLAAADPSCLRPTVRCVLSTSDVAAAVDAGADGVLAPASAVVADGAAKLAGLRVGAILLPGPRPVDDLTFVWAVLHDSLFDVRPGRPWFATDFAGSHVDTRHLAFGYAKANRFCHVFQSDGVHVVLDPYQAAAEPPGDLTEDLWYALRDWPFYSGGGVGLLPGVRGDFAAEVDFRASVATQATMCELAAVNVDPGTHRPDRPAGRREKDSFFDPHGAPPFVGVEHDEDDGYRINWNLGTEYDNNRYGVPSGDGTVLSGRFRLERRGAYFSAYYRNAADAPDWVCVGAARNDSMNPTVFLRCVGKRWRQERGAGEPGYHPIVANEFVFTNLTITHRPLLR